MVNDSKLKCDYNAMGGDGTDKFFFFFVANLQI